MDVKLEKPSLTKAFFPWNSLPEFKKVSVFHTGVFPGVKKEKGKNPHKTQIAQRKKQTISVTL